MNRDRNNPKGPGKKALRNVPQGFYAKEAMGKREEFQLLHRKKSARRTHRRKPSKSELKKDRLYREYPLDMAGVTTVGAGLSIVFASYTLLLAHLAEPEY